ncbi:MAG: HAMP domain-containing sensor histidine kinase [Granulicella sp.]
MNRSIRRNILLLLVVAQGLLTAVCATALVVYVNQQRLAVIDTELERRIGLLVAALQIDDEDPSKLDFTRPEPPSAGDLYVIQDHAGAVLGMSRPGTSPEQISEATSSYNFTDRGNPYRGRVKRGIPVIDPDEENSVIRTPQVNIWYAMPLSDFDRDSRTIVLIAIGCSLFWVASSCIIAWFSVTKGMVPLMELARQASAVSERSWALSLSPDVRDISEIRPLALSLEALVTRLSIAFSRERTFVNDAAHELKTVVAIQKSSLQVALHGDETVSEYRRGLERALEDLDRLNALVHRMLSLASIEGSDRAKESEWVSLEETILAACDQLAPVAAAYGVAIMTKFVGHYYIASEEGLLQTLWVTLLENAIRYSPPDSSVKITCSLEKHLATVVVEDCGAGIPAEDLPHVFERFYRGDVSRSRETGGFGLGLAIAKAIAERHRGEIEIKSGPGSGTIVRVSLPCA